MGDIDSNAEITVNDIAKLKLHLIEKKFLEGIMIKAADIDDNGEITINDLARMKLISIGLLQLK